MDPTSYVPDFGKGQVRKSSDNPPSFPPFSTSINTYISLPVPTNPNSFTMGVERKVIKEGNGVDFPKKNDNVTIDYTGTLFDPNSSDEYKRGSQ